MKMLIPFSTSRSFSGRPFYSSLMDGDVFEDFDRVIDSLIRPEHATTLGFRPTCDIGETDQHFLLSFDLPGMRKEDIKIEVQGNTLSISGEKQRDLKDSAASMRFRHERTYGKFERSFELPTSISTEKIEAQYENGVLNVVLPKAEAAKARQVQIQTGESGFFKKLLNSSRDNEKDLKDVKVS